MTRGYRLWYFLVVLAALAPAASRWGLLRLVRGRGVDPQVARAGGDLFHRDWQVNDPLCPGGDGLGPLYNATSCVACHNQGGPGGAGGLEHNVTTFTVRLPGQKPRSGVVHAHHTGGETFEEALRHVHPELPPVTRPALWQLIDLPKTASRKLPFPDGVHVSQRNTPALFGANLIDEIPERVILSEARRQRSLSRVGKLPTAGRAVRLGDGRVGRFGWKAQSSGLSDFVRAACANELGLGNPGQAQPVALYAPDAPRQGADLTNEQCDQLTTFCASLARPVERPCAETAAAAKAGKELFGRVGCAACHLPKLGKVEGVYSDLLLHDMGVDLEGGGSYHEVPVPPADSGGEPSPGEWRTPPLWGVADSAPYLHDGRAATLEEAIRLHGGQGKQAAERFATLSTTQRAQLVAFLQTLRAP